MWYYNDDHNMSEEEKFFCLRSKELETGMKYIGSKALKINQENVKS